VGRVIAVPKAGVINLTRSLALEYAEQNIRINALCPGFIDTLILPAESKEALAETTWQSRRNGKSCFIHGFR